MQLLQARPRSLALAAAALATSGAVQAQSTLHHVYGDSSYDLLGFAVDGAGDVDGDGVPDWIAGAPGDSNNGQEVGYARVYSGADGAILRTFQGDAKDDLFGSAVAGIGDADGDGRGDLAVGAYFDDDGGINAGRVKVYSGASGNLLYVLDGDAAGDYFGRALAGAGDVNGDGRGDLIVGAPYADAGGSQRGYARVFSGADGSVLHSFVGLANGDQLGKSVAGAGDTSGDGFDDLIVGTSEDTLNGFASGGAFVFSGANGSVLHHFIGDDQLDRFGHAVAGAGDVTADGFDDVIVGAPSDDDNGPASGSARVFCGLTGVELFTFYGDAEFDSFGTAVDGAGDANGDGTADLLVGAPNHDGPGPNAGQVRVFSGADGSVLWTVAGDSVTDTFGGAVAGVGDMNGDGADDVVAGAHWDGVNGGLSGSAEVLSGVLLGSYATYCSATANSSGGAASIGATGSASAVAGDLVLHAQGLPSGVPGLFFYGGSATQLPFGDGFLCTAGAIFRLQPPLFSDDLGTVQRALDLSSPPADAGPGAIAPGDTWYFQFWFRDLAAGGAGFNTTDGLAVSFGA